MNTFCGAQELSSPGLLHIGPKAHAEEKKCPRMSKKNPSCKETSPRTILSSANQNHKKEERHALKDSLLGRHKQKGLT